MAAAPAAEQAMTHSEIPPVGGVPEVDGAGTGAVAEPVTEADSEPDWAATQRARARATKVLENILCFSVSNRVSKS